MSEFGNQINFAQLLDRHRTVQVPMIQRDYAQGRESEVDVRKEFLNTLHNALALPVDAAGLPLNLDFIYGNVEGDGPSRFLPLDGQQRLTTLFLLHWYLAWQDDSLEEFNQLFFSDGHSRFSYSVRPSSKEFYDELAGFRPACSTDSVESLSRLVTNQPWYFRYWRLDPTIQSSLRMLDAIHERFRGFRGFYKRIIDTERPAITFQLLNLENFGLSDDLYIKMNARGKPLTSFETFKARYEQELVIQFEGETRAIEEKDFSVTEYFSRRMDTTWADFFWVHRNKDTNLYDEAVMNLFRAVAIVTRDPESESYLKDISALRNKGLKSSYSLFHSEGWLDRNFSEVLILLLDEWSKGGGDFSSPLPNMQFFDDAQLFTRAVTEPTDLGYLEIVQFVGYIIFLREHRGTGNPDIFQEWMRIVFNLSVNTSYDRASDMQRSISGLQSMASHSGNILQFFAAIEKPTAGFSPQQVSEEKFKAELILANDKWKPMIDRAERHGYFRGQIDFLLDFCGALEMRSVNLPSAWEVSAHSSFLNKFEDYLGKVEEIFTPQGLTDLRKYRLERALLSVGDYLLPSGSQNVSFLVNSSTDQASWKRLLRGTGPKVPEAREVFHRLLDRLTSRDSLATQLDEIIASAGGLEPWREAIVRTPKAISYCEKKAIRRNSETEIYLLSKTQMNGLHAELFSFCLYHNSLAKMANEGKLSPFASIKYESVVGTGVEPGIRLFFTNQNREAYFDIELKSGEYLFYVGNQYLEKLPELVVPLKNLAGFSEQNGLLSKRVAAENVEAALLGLAQTLANTFPSSTLDTDD
jgi:hypothetical protein